MPIVRTVLGDVDACHLGVTNGHEHLLIRSGLVLMKEPDFRLDSVEKAVEEAKSFQKLGGETLVDTAPIGFGRDPDGLRTVARATGLHIIASTGFHKPGYYLDSHWRWRYTVDEVAKLLIEEVELGMDQWGYEGPLVKRSEGRAGVVKVASDYQRIDKPMRAAFEAAAITHKTTGVPILTHTEMGTMGLEQIRVLQDLGVDPSHVVLSHVDRNPDWRVHRDLAQAGAYLEYDGAGRVKYFPESTLVSLIQHMFEYSLGNRIILGGDTARRSYWKAYGGGPGLAYLLEHFVPRLRREGLDDLEIRKMLVENPARAFAFARQQEDSRTKLEQETRTDPKTAA